MINEKTSSFISPDQGSSKKLPWYKKVWNFLDGSKTVIGTICFMAANAIPDPTAKTVLEIAGYALGGSGLVHKGLKNIRNK